MKRADATKGETGAYTLYWEGTDEDGDGFINEDGPGGVDLNRNFQHAYPHWQADAGPHMVSEVESRALMDFTIAHRNIGAILTFGETDNLVTPPDSRGALAGAKVLDLPTFADASLDEVFSTGVFASAVAEVAAEAVGGGGGGGSLPPGRPVGRDNDPSSGTRPATTVATGDQVYFTHFRSLQADHRNRERPGAPDTGGSLLPVRVLPVRRPLLQHPGLGHSGREHRRSGLAKAHRQTRPRRLLRAEAPVGRRSQQGEPARCRTGHGCRWTREPTRILTALEDEHRGLRRLELLPASRTRGGGDRRVPTLHDPESTD